MFINGIEFFGGYIINTSVVVCCYNNEIKKGVSPQITVMGRGDVENI